METQSLSDRVQQLVGRTKKKLGGLSAEDKFAQKIKVHRQQQTFVDLEDKLKQLNVIEDPHFFQQIINKRDKLLQQLELDQELKKRENQKQNLEAFEKMSMIELSTKNEHEYEKDHLETKLQWVPKVSELNSPKKLSIKYELIKLAKQKVEKDKESRSDEYENMIKKQLISDEELFREQQKRHNEGMEFYTDTITDYRRRQFLRKVQSDDFSNKKLDLKLQLNQINEYLQHMGIDLDKRNIVPNESFYQKYKDRANQMIQKAQEISKRRLSQKQIIPHTDEELKTFNKVKELIEYNRRLFRRRREKKSLLSPKQAVLSEESLEQSVASLKLEQKEQSRALKISHHLTPLEQVTTKYEMFSTRLKRTQSEFQTQQNGLLRNLEELDEQIVNTESRYPRQVVRSLQVDAGQMSSYLKLTQKLRSSNLYRRKNNSQSVLRKQKIQKQQYD